MGLPLAFVASAAVCAAAQPLRPRLWCAAGHLGVVLLAVRLFDAFIDPLAGTLEPTGCAGRHRCIALGGGSGTLPGVGFALLFFPHGQWQGMRD
jgi:GPH family glycoside/pentoside/hexuronide:cation symporter